jgi:hypothetical protein
MAEARPTGAGAMIGQSPERGVIFRQLEFLAVIAFISLYGFSQAASPVSNYERAFPQSKSAVEKALKELQSSLSGRLPGLEGFAQPGQHPLSQYQRGFYQSTVQVKSNASGGSVVRVSTKVTAWYADSTTSHSGYQMLSSNGRLENDLLDQLNDVLASVPNVVTAESKSDASSKSGVKASTLQKKSSEASAHEPTISAPMPRSREGGATFPASASSSAPRAVTREEIEGAKAAPPKPSDRSSANLEAEAASFEEVLKNQAHPKNLVAIKKSGTPVVSTPSLNGKTLFLASAQDEFEMLDFNADWVHVKISGLSRGWVWRTSLEMPQGISDIPKSDPSGRPIAADLFQVTREETAPFPGDWEPLRGKTVKIISVQKIQENEKDSGALAKLAFAKSLIDKNYATLASKSQDLSGIVLIFDSVDGGMIAATRTTVQAWKAGTLSDAALWHQCYFDPPETFTVSANPASGH